MTNNITRRDALALGVSAAALAFPPPLSHQRESLVEGARGGTSLALLGVDSDSTRTESCVAIRPDPEAQTGSTPPKAVDRNGYQQISRPRRGMWAGLKILVSAVQSRPSPPFISNSCPPENFPESEFVPKLCLTRAHSSAFQRTKPSSDGLEKWRDL